VASFERNMAAGPTAKGTGACLFVPPRVIALTNAYDETFIGYACTDWDFTDRLPPLGVQVYDLTKQTGIRAMHQPHPERKKTNPVNPRNRAYYKKMKGKQPKRNLDGWGLVPEKAFVPRRLR